jgi:cyclic pyranopterin phosphate synthase
MQDGKGMVDVSGKEITVRTAEACGCIEVGDAGFAALAEGACVKGDVLETAKIAAVNAVKSTPALIPMCHTVLIESVEVSFETDQASKCVTARVKVKSSGKTGVEMEALVGASAACLTIYDMLKYTGKGMTIKDVKLMAKAGGKSGDYKRDN